MHHVLSVGEGTDEKRLSFIENNPSGGLLSTVFADVKASVVTGHVSLHRGHPTTFDKVGKDTRLFGVCLVDGSGRASSST